MAFEYTNRKDKVYYLQAGTTRTGKPKYYFGKKVTGTPVDEIPEGYVVYEAPDTAQVYLRKPQPTDITESERELVEEAIRRETDLNYYIVAIEKNSLVVYLPDMTEESADDLVRVLAGPLRAFSTAVQDVGSSMIRRSQYSKTMQFTLVDAEERLFAADRWCYLGAIDDWFPLQGRGTLLPELLEQYIPHLGRESFYDLM